jgi:hypothetical protein
MKQYVQPQIEIHTTDCMEPLCASLDMKVDSNTTTTTVLTNENGLWDEEEDGFGQQSTNLWQE